MKANRYPDVDPWVVEWFEQNGEMMDLPAGGYTPEFLAAARTSTPVFPVTVEIARVTEDVIAGVPVWIYEHDRTPSGVVVYAHGGAFTTGSPALMDPIARGIAGTSGAAVVSVDYRLAPEHPYPAGLDDFEAVTRWVAAHAEQRFGVAGTRVALAGESAGGNLSAALALRLRDVDGPTMAAQLLLYPAVADVAAVYPSRTAYDGLVLGREAASIMWEMYTGVRDLADDPYVVPLAADDLSNLPPAFVMVGGCDWLRDEGLEFARRLGGAGVPTEILTCPGQPHAFINLLFPASADVYAAVGPWLRARFDERSRPTGIAPGEG